MNILALDTTSRSVSMALLDQQRVILEYNFFSDDSVSSQLLPSLDMMLKSSRLTLDQVMLFGIGIGPGLFTGIRIGVSALKGMLYGHSKSVVPVVTLEALAYKISETEKRIVPLIDARRNEVYLAGYQSQGEKMEEWHLPTLCPIHSLNDYLPSGESFAFVGSGAELHREWIKENFPGSGIYYRSHFLAAEIGKIAWQRFQRNEFLSDLQKLTPLYIRRPDAEMDRKGGR